MRPIRRKGINYDTGFTSVGGQQSRRFFEPAQVRRELEIIARDLHCNAVRISGGDPRRIALAAEYALDEGLEVWFSPFPTDMTAQELMPYFVEAAALAEELRSGQSGQRGASSGVPADVRADARIVFVLGCEMSLYNSGFVPGSNMFERFQAMMNPALLASYSLSPEKLAEQFNSFLGQAARAVRQHFSGPVSYASGAWERIDWSNFDMVGVDLYRDSGNRETYREQVRSYKTLSEDQEQGRGQGEGKPVVITEFGCCTYRGAQDRGALGWAIVDRKANPPRLTEEVVRDEEVQATYLVRTLDVLAEARVDGAFWFTFAGYEYPYNPDPHYDLDCASYGVVKMLDAASGATGTAYPGLPWEPKCAFYALAEYYAK
jgi:hypothetical protein